jgi:hypothetical protein
LEELLKPMASKKTKTSKPQLMSGVRQKPQLNDGATWEQRVENLKLISEWYWYSPWDGITKDDLLHFAMYGDIVAQVYFHALRKASAFDEVTHQLFPNNFEDLLLKHIRRLNEALCEMAKNGRLTASQELWDQSLKLTEAFSELALKNPDLFKTKARQSLFMPSIRSKNPKFSANAKEIAKAVELSAETVGAGLHDNRTPLGALTAKLVGECVDEITRTRKHWSDLFAQRGAPVMWPTQEQIKPFLAFRGKGEDAVLAGIEKVKNIKNAEDNMKSHLRFFCILSGCGVDRIHFLALEELTQKESPHWWKKAIEKMVEVKFPKLLEQPVWKTELKKVSSGTQSDMLHELKKFCVGKVKQFA